MFGVRMVGQYEITVNKIQLRYMFKIFLSELTIFVTETVMAPYAS